LEKKGDSMKPGVMVYACGVVLTAGAAFLAAGTVRSPLSDAVERANSAWDGQMRRGDAAGIASAYGEDGVFVGLDGQCFRGPTEIEGRMRRRFETSGNAVATSLHSKKLMVQGDLGFEWGDASMTFRDPQGKTVESGGGYFTIWRRASDGAWKIFRNVVLP
jgi:ketosteroid isomerase-like protein